MQPKNLGFAKVAAVAVLLRCLAASVVAQPTQVGDVWCYTLLSGSTFLDAWQIPTPPDILLPVRGTFQLRLVEQNPLFSTYAVENLVLVAGTTSGPAYKMVGTGTYRIGGEVAVQQDMWLAADLGTGGSHSLCYFTNSVRAVTRLWPMLQISLVQTNATALRQFYLDLAAAPFRELWFSTVDGFKAGIWNSPTNAVSGGDLLSSVGRVVKRNQALTQRLGLMPMVPDLGLKAVDVLPGGEIAFSMEQDVFSETLGWLHHGDLLSHRGRILWTNSQLISAFVPQPPVPAEVGLDAVQVMDSGEIYFSIQTNFFSEKLGRTIGGGDLLSSGGAMIKANAQLLARFNPSQAGRDYGLRAAYP